MEHNVNKRKSSGETALMIACKYGNVAALSELSKRRDDDGDRDESGQTALSFAKQSNSAEIGAMIEQNLFLRAVENGDTETVKTYLTAIESNCEGSYRCSDTDILIDHHENNSEQMEIQSREDDLSEGTPLRRFKAGIETEFTSKDSITHSVWLEAVTIAQNNFDDDMLYLLFNDHFIHRFNEDGQTIIHQVVVEYLEAKYLLEKLEKIEILLKFGKFCADISNLQNETIFEIICKTKPKDYSRIDKLLLTFLRNRIDLNGRNKNGDTFLMLACEHRRFDIVHSLIKLALREFDLDIDAVDNSGETALMKAEQNNESKIVAALLGKTLISAAEHENEDTVLKDGHFLLGFNEDELTTFCEVVAEYLEVNMFFENMKTIEIVLKSWKFNASILNLQNEAIFEIICKIKPECGCKISVGDLLQILYHNGIDLSGRNKNGETFLMLACKSKRMDIVHSLLDLASQGHVLDIDAVDNSGESALMKAKENDLYEIFVALLKFKFISAVKDENTDVVKSMLAEFHNTLDVFVKFWSSNQNLDSSLVAWETKSNIWLEAMNIAMENDTKHSEEILELLLDCDILLSQEMEAGYSSFNQLMHGWHVDSDKKLRLIELLLKSGKINVNNRDGYGRTALHWAEDEKLIALLIRYGADVSRKDNEGKTSLNPISDKRGTESFPVLQTLFKEAGTLVGLDAMDCNGRTALMHAVMMHRSHDVGLLLNAGASTNLYDHLGFTALHYALHGNIDEHLRFPQNSEELKEIKEMAIFFDAENHEHPVWRNEEWSEERRKIVEMLLSRPDIDVNALSFEMFSPLDIVEGQMPEIPSSIKNALKEKGAVLNFFRQTESQSTSVSHQDFTCKLTLTFKQLDRTIKALNSKNLYFFKEKWLTLIETFKGQRVSDKDQQGRTALHLVAIFSYSLPNDSLTVSNLANTISDKLISLGCSVNEPDIFGRTPLHYSNEILWDLLISKGANASIKEKNGNIAINICSRQCSYDTSELVCTVNNGNDETYILRLLNNKQMEINVHCVDDSNGDSDGNSVPEFWGEEVYLVNAPRLLWEKGGYAFRHPLLEHIMKDVRDLMDTIVIEITRLDQRFEIRPELVGSSNEGAKLNKPDEFDFCFVLTKISELCEVFQSPELPTGFVRLKRKPTKVDEKTDFDSFFGKDGIMNTEKLNWQFTTILNKALVNINSQLSFEWILELTVDYTRISDNIKKVLNVKMIKPLNFFTVDDISIDIVPCIHVDGWWPDEAISNVSDEIKKFGCNLVFDRPQELYPWVPYSESCARISFSKAESDLIKQSCDNARESYMIGKTLVENSIVVSKYVLKNCLLYCIEALLPSSEKATQLGLSLKEMKSKFHQIDRYLWLKCLLKCRLEFVAQDFCPCYFLPTFSNCSLIEKGHYMYLKKASFDWIANRRSAFPLSCKEACTLYRCSSNDITDSSYQLPAPDPLWERFDLKQLIAGLCEIAYK